MKLLKPLFTSGLTMSCLFFLQPLKSQEIFNQGFDLLPTVENGWIVTPQTSYTSASGSGKNIPSVKFGATNDYVETPVFQRANYVSFWLKGYSTDTYSSFVVQCETDSVWHTLDSISYIQHTEKVYKYTIDTTVHKLRFVYHKSAGNVAFDDVTVGYDGVVQNTVPQIQSGYPKVNAISAYHFALDFLSNADVLLQYIVCKATDSNTVYHSIQALKAKLALNIVDSGKIEMINGVVGQIVVQQLSANATYTVFYELVDKSNDTSGFGSIECITRKPSPDIFFSEIDRGEGSNKFIEIYNPSTDTAFLSAYRIAMATNGGGWKTTYFRFKEGALITPNAVYVIAKTGYDTTKVLLVNEVTNTTLMNFTGNDARAIEHTMDNENTWEQIDIYGNPLSDIDFAIAGTSKAAASFNLLRKPQSGKSSVDWQRAAGTDTINSDWMLLPLNDLESVGYYAISRIRQQLVFSQISFDGQIGKVTIDTVRKLITALITNVSEITDMKLSYLLPKHIVSNVDEGFHDFETIKEIRLVDTLTADTVIYSIKLTYDKAPQIVDYKYHATTSGIAFQLFFDKKIRIKSIENKGVTLLDLENPEISIVLNMIGTSDTDVLQMLVPEHLKSNHRYVFSLHSVADTSGNILTGFEYTFTTPKDTENTVESPRSKVAFWPNPVKDVVHFSISGRQAEINSIRIFSMQGVPANCHISAGNNGFLIDISQLKAGVYVVEYRIGSKPFTVRIVK